MTRRAYFEDLYPGFLRDAFAYYFKSIVCNPVRLEGSQKLQICSTFNEIPLKDIMRTSEISNSNHFYCLDHVARKDGEQRSAGLQQYFIAQARGKSWRNGEDYFPEIISRFRS